MAATSATKKPQVFRQEVATLSTYTLGEIKEHSSMNTQQLQQHVKPYGACTERAGGAEGVVSDVW
jgi:hypothetical protein